jgi:hypothetical protein
MRRLSPFVHEGDPGVLLFNPSLALDEGIHGAIEDAQVTQPFYVNVTRVDRAVVEESMVVDLRKSGDRGRFDGFVPGNE